MQNSFPSFTQSTKKSVIFGIKHALYLHSDISMSKSQGIHLVHKFCIFQKSFANLVSNNFLLISHD